MRCCSDRIKIKGNYQILIYQVGFFLNTQLRIEYYLGRENSVSLIYV